MLSIQTSTGLWTPIKFAAVSLGVVLALPVALATAQESSPPTVEDVMSVLGYTDEDRTALQSGKIVATDVDRDRDDQLKASVAVYLPASVAELLAGVRSGDGLRADLGAPAVGLLGSESNPADWQGLAYTDSERDEATKLLGFKGGSDFNLGEDEIAALQSKLDGVTARSNDMLDKVSAAYRDVLIARHDAYVQHGLDGVSDYKQGGTTLEPSAQLADATAQGKDFLSRHFPDFWNALSNYPEAQSSDIVHNFYWLKRQVEGRPDFVLMHEMSAGNENYTLMTRREYFVGHTYESLQAVALALPVENGSAVFYVNAAFTDQITGFIGGIASSVGQGRMRDDLTKFFEEVQARQ